VSNEKFELQFGPTASALILSVSRGLASEILCIGTRGEGKICAALAGMGAHATEHKRAGFPLPVPWVGIMDTFQSHREKTHKSLMKPFWQGAWRIEDGGHTAVLNCGGVDGVVLSLFGIEDTQAIDRARGEWACGWIDEAAPTLEGVVVDELVFDVLATSLRVPTHFKVKLVSENFPDETHWTWERFKPLVGAWGVGYHPEDRQRMTIMIPKGDSPHLTDKDRAEWARALKDRPDLAARLLEGRPGSVMLGPQVAVDFREDRHVAKAPLQIFKGEPLASAASRQLPRLSTVRFLAHLRLPVWLPVLKIPWIVLSGFPLPDLSPSTPRKSGRRSARNAMPKSRVGTQSSITISTLVALRPPGHSAKRARY
jgi:hypothetical protein